ncbi:MAG: hypothetical protein QM653_15330 [Dysgonomonas sp.]|uniref:hypothetical protein n=1 Tax=Dysgonomonas sp. TaxID=1891233 RepID=UPI0039E44F60
MRLLKSNIARKNVALSLIVLVLSTWLIKPVHVAFAHHDDHGCYTGTSQSSNLSHKDCDICQFVFSNYIPQQSGDFKPFVHRPYTILGENREVYHTINLIRFFSLRAPPAVA